MTWTNKITTSSTASGKQNKLLSTEKNVHRQPIFIKLNTQNTTRITTNQPHKQSKHHKPKKTHPRTLQTNQIDKVSNTNPKNTPQENKQKH